MGTRTCTWETARKPTGPSGPAVHADGSQWDANRPEGAGGDPYMHVRAGADAHRPVGAGGDPYMHVEAGFDALRPEAALHACQSPSRRPMARWEP